MECACVNNDDFTPLVSGGHRLHRVSVCTVEQWICIKFYVRLERSSMETIWMIQKAAAMGNRWLIGSFITTVCLPCIKSHAEFFGKTWNQSGDSGLLQSRFDTLRRLAFPKTKITDERKEISNCQWDLGKYSGAADGDWENCVTSQGAYFEGDWGVIVLCTMFLVSCIFFSKCLFFILHD